MNNPVGIAVDNANDHVIVQFDREVGFLRLTPKQAVDLADAIVRRAMDIGKGKSIIELSPH
jgi:hypothetical protein